MNLTLSEKIMYSTIPITMLDDQQRAIGTASGFCFDFCPSQEEDLHIPALVTNRHVLGKCPFISVVFTEATSDWNPNVGKTVTSLLPTSLSVFHPNSAIDLAVIPIAPALKLLEQDGHRIFYTNLDKLLIPQPEVWDSFDAMEEVTMVGYPKGLRDTVNNLPIFRRGITATHPKYDYQGTPAFLADMACYPGSSGSPVFLLNEGSYFDSRNGGLRVGVSRVYLLGVQHAAPTSLDIGELLAIPSSQTKLKPAMQSFINLGVIIKSSELLAFEPILQAMAHK